MGARRRAAAEHGFTGEIVIRGANVTAGYENNPKANEEGFRDGWFRTGDQGTKDADGYLTITGRLKEIINRGGEKISPREIDEILMDHPAVAQVVCFGMPHGKLGEEVAAVVVLKARSAAATDRELQAFVATRVGRLQGAGEDPVHGRDPEGRHRQAAAHRPGPEARSRLTGRSRRRDTPRKHAAGVRACALHRRMRKVLRFTPRTSPMQQHLHRGARTALCHRRTPDRLHGRRPGSRPSRSSSSCRPAPAAAPTRWRASSRAWWPRTS